jgi:molybdopterin converting factor small subunit
MAVTVYIPTPFRRATSNRDRVEVRPGDVAAVLDELEAAYGGLRGLVRNERGEVHRHVAIYVNNEAIEALGGLATRLSDGDEVAIIPALAGGRC